MNVFLLTDLEGIAGVTDIEFMDRSGEKYSKARNYLTQSINLATGACFEAGAQNVYYLDGHGGGNNVYEELIDPRAVKCTIPMWETLLKEGKIDCQIELGSHARAGTIGGFLDHTVTSASWFCHRVGGVEMSELSLHALLCGTYGVPVVACIGDETACRQAREYIPGIFVGAVKKAECRNFAVDHENADEILVDCIKRALAGYRSVPLYTLELPATVELTYYRTDMCEQAFASCAPCVERVDARTLRKRIERIEFYSDLKP